jgi:hypothetical protein
MLGVGVGLMMLGVILVRWGVHALSKKPTAASDYRVICGAALVGIGLFVLILRLVVWLVYA